MNVNLMNEMLEQLIFNLIVYSQVASKPLFTSYTLTTTADRVVLLMCCITNCASP